MPVTEKRGRRHSSEVAVVALDGTGPARVKVNKADVRVDTYRDTGPGGQHRNKTESAIRIVHLPTGTVVTAAEERSQHQNRAVAWERLRTELERQANHRAHDQANEARTETIGTGRAWTWTGWRDEVKGPGGRKASMSRALAGRLGPLVK